MTEERFPLWAAIPGGILVGCALLGVLVAMVQFLFGAPRFGLFYGSVARSMIPLLACAVIVISVGTRPWLLYSEQHLLSVDTITGTPSNEPGFTQTETRLTNRLIDAVRRAGDTLE